MQSTNSEYGSPYLVVCCITITTIQQLCGVLDQLTDMSKLMNSGHINV